MNLLAEKTVFFFELFPKDWTNLVKLKISNYGNLWFHFFFNFPGKSQVSLCINVTYSNALTIVPIDFSGTSTRDNRPAVGPASFLFLYGITSAVSWLSHLTSELGVFWRTWPEIKTTITLKIGNFSDEQGLQNNFNCKYLYNSKMVVIFLTNSRWMR